ncbi:spore germination protein [Paenibacillus sp. J5C_2022]|uniref:GerAB/ArcD/ProY family transporter n=1 Tax=Paenibacillus sp. J5C2022 TaxID=2977129 RepID=UPI0021D2CC29|nr:spore germination protein [Paenibacillus sp. J5C2022]MCU6710323.1 spore germination protein [Paenibacillus sp. J5C2022]
MTIKPFGIWPLLAIILLSGGLVNHVLIAPFLLEVAHRDAWISVILAMLIILPWTLLPLYGLLNELDGVRIDHWLKQRMHPFFAYLLIIGFLVYLLFMGTETLTVTSSWTSTTYLPRTPISIVIAAFLSICLYAVMLGLRTIAYISCILVPGVVILGDFVMSTNLPHKDYRYLLPVLEHGYAPVWQACLVTISAFSELFILLFVQHHMRGRLRRKHLVLLVFMLALLTIGPLTGAISQFGPEEAGKMRYPAFSQWRLVTIGRYFEHVDFFAIFQWLSGALVRVSLLLYVVLEYSPVRRMKRPWAGAIIAGTVLGLSAYYWAGNMIPYKQWMKEMFLYIGPVVIVLTIVLSGIGMINKGKEGTA